MGNTPSESVTIGAVIATFFPDGGKPIDTELRTEARPQTLGRGNHRPFRSGSTMRAALAWSVDPKWR